MTHANNITLNAKKSNYVIFRPYKKKVHHDNETNKSVNSLERKYFINYLGVLKDENLSWRKHIVRDATKISKTIDMLSKLRHFVHSPLLVNIYNALKHLT